MAKKQQERSGSMQQKAKAMREAQAKADRRTRNIIITVAAVLSVAIIAAVALVILRTPSEEGGTAGLDGELARFANGEPITVSSEGVMGMDPEVPDVEMYFSYSCSACAVTELSMGPDLVAGAEAGEYNLVLRPVITSEMAFTYAATGAALTVAAEAPEQFVDFQQALAMIFYAEAQTGDISTLQDADASAKAIADMALELGIPSDLVDQFSAETGSQYLQKAQALWMESEVEGRDGFATPEFVVAGKAFERTGDTAEEQYQAILDAVKAAK